jgi:hypothetical protein
MATELIATGTIEAASADITLADGASAIIFLKDAAGPAIPAGCTGVIQIKTAASTYFTLGVISGEDSARKIEGPGVYRVFKPASANAFGVEQA